MGVSKFRVCKHRLLYLAMFAVSCRVVFTILRHTHCKRQHKQSVAYLFGT